MNRKKKMQIPIFWEDFLQDFGASGGWGGWPLCPFIQKRALLHHSSMPFMDLARWRSHAGTQKAFSPNCGHRVGSARLSKWVQVTIHTWVMAGKEVCVCGGGRGVKMDILRSESGLFRSESSASMHGSDIQSTWARCNPKTPMDNAEIRSMHESKMTAIAQAINVFKKKEACFWVHPGNWNYSTERCLGVSSNPWSTNDAFPDFWWYWF